MCSQDQIEILLSRILEKTIRRSGALDTESLCIVAGQKCFQIRADIHVLDHDGNLVDASCVALVAALMHFRRPDVEVHGEEVKVFGVREREPVRLSMQHQPFCITTSYYDNGEVMLQDATLLEEQCREGEIVISINRFGEVCQIAKLGGTPSFQEKGSIVVASNVFHRRSQEGYLHVLREEYNSN